MTKNTTNNEWGNIELPGLSDEKLFGKDWAKVQRNRDRWADPAYRERVVKTMREVVDTPEWRQQLKDNQEKIRTPEWYAKHAERMKQVYADPKWLESVTTANKNPDRNKKISEKLSVSVKTPDGVFDSIGKCAEFYSISSEGVRYRCATDSSWSMLTPKKISNTTKQKLKESAKKTATARLTTIAKTKGYVYTPYGKFLSVRQAWLEEVKHNPNRINNPHNWFKKMSEQFPKKYYKK